MDKKRLLFRKGLKAMLFLSVLSICSPSVWAQDEVQDKVELGFVKFLYSRSYLLPSYLCEMESGGIGVNSTSEVNVFFIDSIGNGRYVMALNYEEKEDYSKGTFLYNPYTALDYFYGLPPLPTEVLENCYNKIATNRIYPIEAIRIGDSLYITPDMPSDMAVLNDMVQSGSVKKIDLSKTNNFMFSFISIEDSYEYYDNPDGIAFCSEIGGYIGINYGSGVAMIEMQGFGIFSPAFFIVEPVQDGEPNSNANFINESVNAYAANGVLTVQSPAIESITVYNATGMMYFKTRKDTGATTFDISNLPQGIYVVKGSSGWANKVVLY